MEDMQRILQLLETMNETSVQQRKAIFDLTQGLETTTLSLVAHRVVLQALLVQLAEPSQLHTGKLGTGICESVEWHESHAINSQMTDWQVENLRAEVLRLTPEPVRSVLQEALNTRR